MKYEDYEFIMETRKQSKKRVGQMTLEEFAAVDIGQQIKHARLQIEDLQKDLERLTKAAKNLPKPSEEDLSISPRTIREGRYKFRGKSDVEEKMYGWSE